MFLLFELLIMLKFGFIGNSSTLTILFSISSSSFSQGHISVFIKLFSSVVILLLLSNINSSGLLLLLLFVDSFSSVTALILLLEVLSSG